MRKFYLLLAIFALAGCKKLPTPELVPGTLYFERTGGSQVAYATEPCLFANLRDDPYPEETVQDDYSHLVRVIKDCGWVRFTIETYDERQGYAAPRPILVEVEENTTGQSREITMHFQHAETGPEKGYGSLTVRQDGK